MYAIVQTSGKQIKVTPGGYATLEGTAGTPGSQLTLEQVLLVEKDGGDIVAGSPFVANARVVAVIEGETRGPKSACSRRSGAKGCGARRATAPPSHGCKSRKSFFRDWRFGVGARGDGPPGQPRGSNGAQEGTRQLTERARLELAATRGQSA